MGKIHPLLVDRFVGCDYWQILFFVGYLQQLFFVFRQTVLAAVRNIGWCLEHVREEFGDDREDAWQRSKVYVNVAAVAAVAAVAVVVVVVVVAVVVIVVNDVVVTANSCNNSSISIMSSRLQFYLFNYCLIDQPNMPARRTARRMTKDAAFMEKPSNGASS